MVFPFNSLSDYEIKFTPEHEMFRTSIRKFMEREVAPSVPYMEDHNEVPDEIIKKLSEQGFFGLFIPQEYGGQGADQTSAAIFSEEVARISPALMVLVAINGLFAFPLILHGTEEQKRKYLTPIAHGEKRSAHATTEAVAGSDVAGIQTKANKVGDKWQITGSKAFISGGDVADYFVVLARTSPLPSKRERWKGLSFFIVEKETKGFSIAKHMDKIGLRGSHIVELRLDDVVVPDLNRVGSEGDGFKIAMETFDHGRIVIAAQALGIIQAAFEKSLDYSLNRQTFGAPLIQNQMIDSYLTDMLTKLVSARHLVYWAANLADLGRKEYMMAASLAKAYSTDAAEWAAAKAISIFGGAGAVTETRVERFLRDAVLTKIYEGSNEIQRLVIIRQLLKLSKGDNAPKEGGEVET